MLRDENLHVGTATVYRTLDLLLRADLVDEHDFGEGFKRYEPRTQHQHHEHIICRECGKVVEFTSDRIERMNVLIAEEYGFRHHHHRLEIHGVCRECQSLDAAKLATTPVTLRSEIDRVDAYGTPTRVFDPRCGAP